MPDWYPLIRAAKYLGVPPWELLTQEPKWYFMALQAEKAEIEGAHPATVTDVSSEGEGDGGTSS